MAGVPDIVERRRRGVFEVEQNRQGGKSGSDPAADCGTRPVSDRRIPQLNLIQIIRRKLHDLDDPDFTFSHSRAVLLMIGFCAAAIVYLIWRILQ